VGTAFKGFPEEGLKFLRSLARNNNRDWFLPRKALFEDCLKQPMRELVEALNADMKRYAPDYVTEPDKAIYRFYRDTRFSKDKTPYKDHIAALFPRRGLARHVGGAYYVAVSHKAVEIAGGVYMPLPETLLAIRNRIAEKHEDLRKIVRARAMKELYGELHGSELSRVPKGFPCSHPAADLLRRKQLYFYVELPPEIATDGALYDTVRKHFRAITPFVEFLNAPFAEKKPKIDVRELFH
jgi:uncharacterized protein (TIGR02453 family)